MAHTKYAHTNADPTVTPAHYADHAAPVSDFAALLGKATANVAASDFSLLLGGKMGRGSRRRLVICSECGEANCTYSFYVDDRGNRSR